MSLHFAVNAQNIKNVHFCTGFISVDLTRLYTFKLLQTFKCHLNSDSSSQLATALYINVYSVFFRHILESL